MNINLAILYGIDDKYSIVKKTIERCKKYFNKIIIINTGGSYTEKKLLDFNHSSIEIYNQDFLWGDTDSSRRYALNLCEENDWLFWLDSDECPTKLLLDNLKDIVYKAEQSNYGNIRFPSSNHTFELQGENITQHNPYKKGCASYPYNSDISVREETFLFNRMLKKTNGAYFISSCGGHSQFAQSNDLWMYSNYLINHYKSNNTSSISCILHTWSTMRTNFTLYNDILDMYNSEEYNIHTKFKRDHNVETSNKLVERLTTDDTFRNKIIDCYYNDLFKNSKFHYRCIYEWIKVFNLNITNNDGDYTCELECCKY
jgi:hypothetical protein